mgnify:CR=1 FL=1|jgi:Chromosome condensation complex Condensin, subunit D2
MSNESRHELTSFFGNDGRAELFIKLFIEPVPDLISSINDEDPNKIRDYPRALNIMRAEDYKIKDPNMRNEDIHNDFTDFIISTALFHKLIEKKDGSDPNAKKFLENVLKNWSSLSQYSKKFYKKFVSFRKKENNKYVKLDPETEYFDEKNINKYQVVINKTGPKGGKIPSFTNMIPLYAQFFNDIWATSYPDDKPVVVKIKSGDEIAQRISEHLKNIYGFEIKGGGISVEEFNPFREIQSVQKGGGNYPKGIFKVIYNLFFNNSGGVVIMNPPTKWNQNVINKIFNISIDKLILNRLFHKKKPEIRPTETEKFEPCISMVDKHVWNIDETGKWYVFDTQGKKVYYDENDPKTIQLLKSNFRCYSSALNFENDEQCEKYMTQCLLSQNSKEVSECIEFWKKSDYFKVTKSEISKMHPLVAKSTLAKFGFREHEVYDPIAKMNIKKVESVDHWLKEQLHKKFSEVATNETGNKSLADVIQENQMLIDYLQMLVDYVNSNPKILNTDISGVRTAEAIGYVGTSKLAEKLGISMRQEPVNVKESVSYDFGRLSSHVKTSYIGQLGRRSNLFSPLPFSFGNVPKNMFMSPYAVSPFSLSFATQYGGQGFGKIHLPMFETQTNVNRITGADALKSIILSTINEIELIHKKVMDKSDYDKIMKRLENLKCIEKDLIDAEMTLQEYRDLLETFNNYEPEVVTEEKIRDYVDKYKGLYNVQFDHETFLLKIFETLQKLLSCEKCNDVEYTEITV